MEILELINRAEHRAKLTGNDQYIVKSSDGSLHITDLLGGREPIETIRAVK